ncbi:hypothetical protein A2954_03740 [Candidatus Roizmanbacteria bacterium RIFCSPLOWO2_01_FULL_37_12]|uniref:HAD family hydrolase n=1 Tax=Candidatus Roizmanbacteria bacterium RIFCSPLOWO2_01_FULL_37_12 TaxID=1802056 RepID=A0A1F7IEM6_9BACT|nr:MAG: hypothetical protein A3D76_05015 [Candidatus Roizmanbacteria bacterium RIFCSPHIGHO2_02_FULL_37_9b]OGK41800.1 MAG: hypothetical protein A2954_03740 [Candidatus Roizmanbacteria bacterium RIFCSPLOWO2_01_FULL_37_12]
MPKIKFIYFDIGGVLIDYKNAFKTATNKFNIPYESFIKVWMKHDDPVTRGKMTPQEFWNNVRKEFKISKGEEFDFLTSWVEDYKPIKTTHAIIKKFINKYKIGLISNLYSGMIPMLLAKELIPDVAYSSIITSYETGFRKPEREIYELATKRVNLNAEEIFFVDDREDFIEGGKSIGWKTFLLNPNDTERSAKKLDRILSSLK